MDNGWTRLADEANQLRDDLITLMGRLWNEDRDTMSFEVQEVLARRAVEFKNRMALVGVGINVRQWECRTITMPKRSARTYREEAEIEEAFRRG